MFTLAITPAIEVLASCSRWTLYAECVGLYTRSLKSIVTQQRNVLSLTVTEVLLWCSWQPAIGLYPARNKSSPYLSTIWLSILKLLSHLRMSWRYYHTFRFPDPNSPRLCVSIVCYKALSISSLLIYWGKVLITNIELLHSHTTYTLYYNSIFNIHNHINIMLTAEILLEFNRMHEMKIFE